MQFKDQLVLKCSCIVNSSSSCETVAFKNDPRYNLEETFPEEIHTI